MTGGNIPIVRWGESRIEVGGPFGQSAELHRGAAAHATRPREAIEVSLRSCFEMRAAYYDDEFTLRRRSGFDRSRCFGLLPRKFEALGAASPDDTAPNQASGRVLR